MSTQSLITVIIALDWRKVEPVVKALEGFGNLHRPTAPDDSQQERHDLRKVLNATGVIHFLSLNVVKDDDSREPAQGDGPEGRKKDAAHFILEISADGSSTDILRVLAPILLAYCPSLVEALGAPREPDALANHLASQQVSVGARFGQAVGLTFSGTPGFSVKRINREAELAKRIGARIPMTKPQSPLQVLTQIRKELWDEGYKWAMCAEPILWLNHQPRSKRVAIALSVLGAVIPLLLLCTLLGVLLYLVFDGSAFWSSVAVLATLMAGAGVPYMALRWRETRDEPVDLVPRAKDVEEILAEENHAVQNHLFGVSVIKPNFIRRLTLRFAFAFIGGMARWSFRPGYLDELGTIHFARWVRIPGTDKLVFLSNYGGSWESYLEDFIQRASRGLTAVWSNTVGYPRTKNLFFDGATDGDRFKRWARRQQRPTLLWYCAYPTLSTTRIRVNALICQGIACARTEAEAADWLSCFGSAPASPFGLEATEIPGLVYGGFSPLAHGRAVLFKLSPDRASEWLRRVRADLTYGDAHPDHTGGATLLALARGGLQALGLHEQDLATFPAAFLNGMAHPGRARALGDVDSDAPESWDWGCGEKEADGVMLLYAGSSDALKQLYDQRGQDLEGFGHRVIKSVLFAPLDGQQNITSTAIARDDRYRNNDDLALEPFGFADGISQPIIRGTRRWTRLRDVSHIVEPGEFILGYPDNSKHVPPSPTVSSARDPDHLLPSFGADPFRTRPDFSKPQPTGEHDFGRNGTYLVVRQLEQDTVGFDTFVTNAARSLDHHPSLPADEGERKDWVAAKLVGRWKDGTSLVRFPFQRGTAGGRMARPDNDFLYGHDDPDGRRCPFGAHIRRVNPRDSFPPHGEDQLKISNRHRILRVGRVYEPNTNGRGGLFFMCLNADIERQFEFVQQTWAGAASFHGLENEVDCFSPRGATERFTIPTEHGPVCLQRMDNFVRTIGGGYFFMPSWRAMRYLAERAPQQMQHQPAAATAPRTEPAMAQVEAAH